jgi:hypothetical protein
VYGEVPPEKEAVNVSAWPSWMDPDTDGVSVGVARAVLTVIEVDTELFVNGAVVPRSVSRVLYVKTLPFVRECTWNDTVFVPSTEVISAFATLAAVDVMF